MLKADLVYQCFRGIKNDSIFNTLVSKMLSAVVVVTGLEPVTSRTSSGCATSCAKRPYSFFESFLIIYYGRIFVKMFLKRGLFSFFWYSAPV